MNRYHDSFSSNVFTEACGIDYVEVYLDGSACHGQRRPGPLDQRPERCERVPSRPRICDPGPPSNAGSRMACAPKPKPLSVEQWVLANPEKYARRLSPKQAEFLIDAYVGTSWVGKDGKVYGYPGLGEAAHDGATKNIVDSMLGWQGSAVGSLRTHKEYRYRPELALIEAKRIRYTDAEGKPRCGRFFVTTDFGLTVVQHLVSAVVATQVALAAEDDAA